MSSFRFLDHSIRRTRHRFTGSPVRRVRRLHERLKRVEARTRTIPEIEQRLRFLEVLAMERDQEQWTQLERYRRSGELG